MSTYEFMTYLLLFLFAGISSGFFSGLFGIGGGVLRIPVFVFIFSRMGVPESILMHVATGTSLALVIPSAIMASIKQYELGMLDLKYYKSWGLAVLIGVLIGEILLLYLTTFDLQVIFIVFLIGIALYVGWVHESWVILQNPPEGKIKGFFGIFVGTFSVLIGIGGGILTTPIMKACHYPLKNAIALATATGIVVGTTGTLGAIVAGIGVEGRPEFSLGYIDLIAYFVMLPTVMVMAPLGARTAVMMKHERLKKFYAIFLILMAIYMLFEI